MQMSRRTYTDTDHLLITSQDPGTALAFAVEIIFQLLGKEKEVNDPMCVIPNLHYDKKFA